ncbi:MAG: hypothetical protein FWE22_02830 [Firmicutes bacterium]|nr:hypothetical protein [Bacillota bacterium]
MFFNTRTKVEKLHIALDELGYRKKNNLIFSDFYNETKRTLTRTAGINGMAEIFEFYNLVANNWDLLIELISGQHKHSAYFMSLEFQGNEILELINEEDAEGTTVITNALNSNPLEIIVFDSENLYIARKIDGVFRFVDDNDWEFYFKASLLKSFKFSFFTRIGEKLFQMTCNDDLDIYITNNATTLDILHNEENGALVIVDYSRDENDQILAHIYCDIVGKGKKYGVCQIDAVTEIDGSLWEMCLLMATCTFFVYNKKLKSNEDNSMALALFALNN